MITFDLVLVILVVIFILISLYRELFGPALTFLIGIVVLGIFGVLTPREIISGFANEQVMVIIMLLLVSDIIRHTAIADMLFSKAFYGVRSYKRFLGKQQEP
jgi:di/tricarboxylate transporter